jgi:hypothetical protein
VELRESLPAVQVIGLISFFLGLPSSTFRLSRAPIQAAQLSYRIVSPIKVADHGGQGATERHE